MRFSSLHTHTTFCDGGADVETMCAAAFEKGLVSLGFSAHAPVPFETWWHLKAERLEEYLAAVRDAKRRWEGRLDIYLGLEVDWVEGICGPADGRFDGLGLDYTIGSVHYLMPPNGTERFPVDGSKEDLEKGIRDGFSGDANAMAAYYWKSVREMVAAGGFDIIGHLDLVKKNNRNGAYFDEGSEGYRQAALGAIAAIAKADVIVEVNTGGLNRGLTTEVYPAIWMLRELRERKVRAMVNADAHLPEHLGGHYAEAVEALKKAGYRQMALRNGSNWIEEPLG